MDESVVLMNSVLPFSLEVIIGGAIGVGITIFYYRTRINLLKTQLLEYDREIQELSQLRLQLQEAQIARTRAEEAAARVPKLEQQIQELSDSYLRLVKENAELKKDQEKIQWLEQSEARLRETFQSLASEILRFNTQDLINRSESIIKPLAENLKQLEGHIRALEQQREGSYRALDTRIKDLLQAHTELQRVTTRLQEALKSPTVRGRWGEYQLRRIVEMAGMTEHVDFQEQPVTEELNRPDLLVYLPNGGVVPVDAKAPMENYLKAVEAPDDQKNNFLEAHAKALRNRLKELGQRKYWAQFKNSPELVVMFVPSESCLSYAFERDPGLFEFALEQRVLPATPVTLLAILKSVAFVWQQHKFEENARLIADAGRELHKHLVKLLEFFNKVGRNLDSTVRAYNDTVASLEKALLPRLRRFMELSHASQLPPDTTTIDRRVLLSESTLPEDPANNQPTINQST